MGPPAHMSSSWFESVSAMWSKLPLFSILSGSSGVADGGSAQGSGRQLENGNSTDAIVHHLNNRIEKLQGHVQRLKKKCEVLENQGEAEAQKHIAQEAALQGERDVARQRVEEIQNELEAMRQRTDNEIESLQRRNASSQKDKQHFEMAAEERSVEISRLRQELSSVRIFLDESDQCSGKELLQVTQDLNTKIDNLAATLSDRWDNSGQTVDAPTGRSRIITPGGQKVQQARARDVLKYALGEPFVEILSRRSSGPPDDKDVTLISFAVQTCAVYYVASILNRFCIGLSDNQDAILHKIYQNIYQNEPQALSSRWRALAHSYGRAAFQNYDEAVKEHISKSLSEFFFSVHALVGRSTIPDSKLREEIASELNDIAGTTLELSLMITEKTMSAKYEVYSIAPGHKFSGAIMEDVFGGDGRSEHTLCTVGLGLVQVVRAAKGSESSGEPSGGEKVLLKPKVVALDSARHFLAQQ